MADAGVGEAMLAAEVVGESSAAAGAGGTIGSLGAGGSFIPAAGESASLFSTLPAAGTATAGLSGLGAASSLMGPTYAELGYNAMGPTYSQLGYTGLGAGQMGPTYEELGYNGLNLEQAAAEGNVAAQAAKDQMLKNPVSNPEFLKNPLDWMMKNKTQTALTAGGIYTLANALKGGALTKPNYLPQYNPVTAQQMGLNRNLAANYQPQRSTMYNRGYAAGGSINVGPGSVATQGVAPADLTAQSSDGITSLANQYGVNPVAAKQALSSLGIKTAAEGGLMQGGPANVDFMGGDMYPQSQIQRSYYATPSQMPTSAQQVAASYEPKTNPLTGQPTQNMADGGITSLGSYSDGGRLLKGPGDGMSDNIPATIAEKQPARLADGEFVVPADVVSHLGNGSTDAGAKQLYSMLDKVRKARTGTKKQGKQIKAGKYLPT